MTSTPEIEARARMATTVLTALRGAMRDELGFASLVGGAQEKSHNARYSVLLATTIEIEALQSERDAALAEVLKLKEDNRQHVATIGGFYSTPAYERELKLLRDIENLSMAKGTLESALAARPKPPLNPEAFAKLLIATAELRRAAGKTDHPKHSIFGCALCNALKKFDAVVDAISRTGPTP